MSDGVAMAAYTDIMILQVQCVQTDPQTVREFVLPLVDTMRRANPALEISVQVAAEGEVAAAVDLIHSLAQDLDGVSILTDHETTGFVSAFTAELRGSDEAVSPRLPTAGRPLGTSLPAAGPAIPDPPATPTTTAPPAAQTQPTGTETSVAAVALTITHRPASPARRRLLLYLASLGLAIFFSGLTVTGMIYAVPYFQVRHRKRESPD